MERRHPSTAATARLDDDERTEPLAAAGGLLLDRYRLVRRLGAGGFGVVWLARDERLERDVAVKAIVREGGGGPTGSDRSEREARAAARLGHPGIVALYELAADDDHVYLVSELVHGRTFAELDRAGALSDRDVAQVGAAVGWALAHAHDRGVIHRDVKPQNVLVVDQPSAGEGFAKLTDFGVAHLVGDDPLTRTGDVVGTLAYMAPEQAEGRPAREPADAYALALMLYEGWTGENPVRAAGPAATARRLGRRIAPVRQRRRDLPPGLCRAIDDALDPRPERRPSVRVLAEVLEAHAGRLSQAGGLVEPGTLARVGLALRGARDDGRPRREPAPAPAGEPTERRSRALSGRLGAALSAAALAYALLALAGEALGLPRSAAAAAPVAAGAAALAVALLPRLGWLAAAAALIGWLALPPTGLDGLALLLAPAVAASPLLLPAAPALWSLPVLAPLLGAIGLATAFPAVAGQARTPLRRAGLAAAGSVTLVAGELATGQALMFGLDAEAARAVGSAPGAARAIAGLAPGPALGAAVVWAALAVILPLLVRGRAFGHDLAGAAAWAAAAIGAHAALAHAVAADPARGAVAGALAGAALALAAAALRPRDRLRPVAVEPPGVP